MANPVFVDCALGAWTKIATNVTSGTVHQVKQRAAYRQTYRTTGGAAPTLESDGVPVFLDGNFALISSSSNIDVYLWAANIAGRVRVDL